MARVILLFFFCIVSTFASAKSAKQWVQELDVVDIRTLPKDNAYSFWVGARDADPMYAQLLKAHSKRKKSYTQAESDIIKGIRSYESDVRALTTNLPTWIDSLEWSFEEALHLSELKKAPRDIYMYDNLSINIVNVNQINACTFPNGTILLYVGLLDIPSFTRKDVLAACAHELAHYMMKHSLSHQYAYIKKQKSNKMWAEIGGCLMIAANAAASMYSASNGVSVNDNSAYYASMYEGMLEDAGESAKRFGFRYTREQELQADILGCRYLQYLGYDGNDYIAMLEKLGTDDDKYYSKKSDHPKIEYRIKVIKELLGHTPAKSSKSQDSEDSLYY